VTETEKKQRLAQFVMRNTTLDVNDSMPYIEMKEDLLRKIESFDPEEAK